MNTSDLKIQLFRLMDSLPEKQLSELYQFVVDFVKKKSPSETLETPCKERKAGSMKGAVLYMAEDFDEPLEDFKDYM